ncbi:MAG: hypothetical protein AB8G05_07490 [Oligoflexales bacterium]
MKTLKIILFLLLVGSCKPKDSLRIRNMIMPSANSGQLEKDENLEQNNSQNPIPGMTLKVYYESYVIAAQALWGLMEFEEDAEKQPSEFNLTARRRLGRATPPPTMKPKPIVWKRDIELPPGKMRQLFHPMIMVNGKMASNVEFLPRNRNEYLREAKKLDGGRIKENEAFAREAAGQNNKDVETRTEEFFADETGDATEIDVFYGGSGYAAFEHFHLFSKESKVLAFGKNSGNFRIDDNFNYRLQQGHSLVHNPARMFNPGDFDSLENVTGNQSVHGRDFALALEANKYADGFPELRGEISQVTHRRDATNQESWPEGAQFEITVKDVSNPDKLKKVYSKKYIEAIGQG